MFVPIEQVVRRQTVAGQTGTTTTTTTNGGVVVTNEADTGTGTTTGTTNQDGNTGTTNNNGVVTVDQVSVPIVTVTVVSGPQTTSTLVQQTTTTAAVQQSSQSVVVQSSSSVVSTQSTQPTTTAQQTTSASVAAISVLPSSLVTPSSISATVSIPPTTSASSASATGAASTNAADNAASSSKSKDKTMVIGIVAALLVLAFLALIVFFVRRRYRNKRERKRETWGASAFPATSNPALLDEKPSINSYGAGGYAEQGAGQDDLNGSYGVYTTTQQQQQAAAGYPQSQYQPSIQQQATYGQYEAQGYGQPVYNAPARTFSPGPAPPPRGFTPSPEPAAVRRTLTAAKTAAGLPPLVINDFTPPSASYANSVPGSPSSYHPASLTPGGNRATANFSNLPGQSEVPPPLPPMSNEAVVRVAFIPSLPDELSIQAGEKVRVLAEYDDGWCMCANRHGDQGMVPLECLEAPMLSRPPTMPAASGRRERRSSLGRTASDLSVSSGKF